MRIALFTDTYAPQVNGVSLTLQRLVQHLAHRSISYQVFVPECNKDMLFENNVHRFTSLPFFLYPECRMALPNVLSMRNQLKQFEPDLIHVATPFNIGLCGLHYSKKYNIPLVSSYHTHFDRYLDYYRLKFAAPWIWRYLRWFHNAGLLTFVPSNETKDKLELEGFKGVDLWRRGVQEIIKHGETGFLCPPRDSDAMLASICQAVVDRGQLSALGRQARRYAVSQSWESIFDRLLQKYEEARFEASMAHKSHSA